MKKFPKELKFFFAVFFVLTLLFSVSSKVLAVENSFDYISGINYEPIAKLVNFLNDKKRELEKLGDSFEKTNSVKNSARDNYGKNKTKNRFLLSVALEPAKDAIIGKPKKYIEKVFCVAKDFVFPGACKESVSQDYSGATTQENNKEEFDALKKQYDDAIVSANELDQKFNLLQKELGKVKAGGVIVKEPIIEQKTVERTIEKIVSGVSQDDLSSSIASIKTELNNLNTNLANQINNLSSNTSRQSTATFQAISLTNRIDNLSGTRLSGITVNGVSGLTNSDIPDDITASNYLPLIGGTISGDLTVTGNATLGVITLQNATAGYFTATSTSQASIFPYASTTALTVSGDSWFNGLSTMANLLLSGSTTLQNFTANNSTTTNATTTNLAVSGSAYLGNLNGPLQANNGLVSATTSVGYQYGGTGLTDTPSFGQILRGTGTGYALVATSTLGINTSDLAEGSNLFWTNDRFDNRLSATTTLPNLTTLASLVSVGTITSGTWNGSSIGDAYINDDITLTNLTQITNRAISDTTGTLSVARGGTGQTSFGQGWLNSDGTTMSASTSPTVNYITATSTTATSTFAGGMSVAGHCVTGDTRLRRRRRKKNGSYEYDEVAIKDIQPGDEIASLDEETGKIVWSKVNALMDMGVKRIYKLTTVSGKTIRTTAEHPYLVKNKEMLPKKAIAFIDYANIKAWLRDKKLSIDLELLIKALVSAGINDVRFYYGSDSEKNSISDFFKKLRSFGYTIITKPIQYFKVSLSYLLKQKTNRMLLESISSAFEFSLEKEALRMDKENISLFAPKANFDVEISVDAIKKSKNIDVFVLFSGDGDFAYLLKELKLLGKKTVVVSGRKSLSGSLVKEADKFVTLERLSGNLPGLVRIDKNAKPARRQVLKNCASNIADLLGLSNCSVDNLATSENGLWKKVVYLKEGMEIAVNDAESDSAIFDKIAQIEILPEEQVYDIEVDGTHNFIGNDIVAHNTYIGGTASSTNLIVSNSSALGTVSSGLWNGSAISTQYGGTGQNFSASSGLINLYSGTASAMATSSLGLLTTDIAEGTNQYWTNTRFDNRLSATTTLPNLTTLLGLTNASTTGLTVSGQTTLATSLTGLLKGASGVVSAITTSLGLAGEISDETGSGALVFGTSPTFTTQITTPSIISSSALGITPASGSNVNVNLAGTGDFAVNTNQLYVDTSTGNVGIGTAEPSGKLHILGSSITEATNLYLENTGVQTVGQLTSIFFRGSDATVGAGAGAKISSVVTNATPGSRGTGLAFFTDNQADGAVTERVRILANGNVGIGTTTPNQKLSVNGHIEMQGAVGTSRALITDETNTGTGKVIVQAGAGSATYGGGLNLFANAHATKPGWVTAGISSGSNGKFTVNDQGLGGGTDLFTVQANGNVGIGTVSPDAPLAFTASVGDKIQLYDNGGASTYGFGVQNNNLQVLTANNTTDITFGYGLSASQTTLMTIKGSGNVGIGTTTPGALLHTLATTEQLRLGYDASNYWSGTVGSTGGLTLAGTGTGGSLALTPTAGQNLNVNLSGAGDLAVNTNQLYVDTSTGNVGIGTVSPIAKLEISGGNIVVGGGNGLYRNYAGSARGIIYNPSAGLTTIRPTDNNAADGIRLEDWAGNAALFVRQDGNVGIGTTTPSQRLTINGGNGVYVDSSGRVGIGVEPNTLLNVSGTQSSVIARFLVDDTTSYNSGDMLLGGRTIRVGNSNVNSAYSSMELMVGNSGFAAIGVATTSNPAAPDLVFGTGGTVAERMRINNAGNVGIGTTTPNTKLSVGDGLSSVGNYWVAGTYLNKGISIAGNSSGEAGALHFEGNRTTAASTAGALVFRNYQSSRTQEDKTIAYITASTPDTYDAEAGTLRFGTHDTTSGLATRMTIDESGNVGIGTTTPTSLLHLSSNSAATLAIDKYSTDTTPPNLSFRKARGTDVAPSVVAVGDQLMRIAPQGYHGTGFGAAANIYVEVDAEPISGVGTPGRIALYTTSSSGTQTERMRIDSSGNVGIGTTTPARTLSVNGTAGTFGQFISSGAGSGVGFYLGDAGADKWQVGLNLALASGGNTFEFRNLTGSGVESPFVIETTGNVGVGTTSPWRTLGVTGTVGFDGLTGSTGAGSLCLDANKQVVYNSASDACLSSTRATKHDIQALSLDGLSLINSLQPSSFIYNQGDGRTRYGFMAEDTALADDRLATHNEKGEITGIDDRAILSVVVKAIKEMKVQLSDLQASVVASGGQTSDSLFSWIMGKFSAIGVVFGQDKLGAKKGVFERFEMKDADTGEDYCVKIRNGEWEKTKGTCGETSISSSSVSSPSSSGAVSSSSSSSAEASSSSSAESSLSSSSSETSSSSSSEASSSSSEASSLSSSSASSSESSSSTSSETGSSSSSSLNSDSSSSSVSSSSSSSAEANSSSSVGSSSSSSSSETSSSSSSEGSSSSVSLEAGSSSSVAS